MIPSHVSKELDSLSKAQQDKFQELVAWACGPDIVGSPLPVDYDRLLSMVKMMGEEPVIPIEPELPKEE